MAIAVKALQEKENKKNPIPGKMIGSGFLGHVHNEKNVYLRFDIIPFDLLKELYKAFRLNVPERNLVL